jgi:hypothetical protein
VAINTEYQGLGSEDAMGHARKAVEEARAFKEAFASKANDFSRSVDLRGRVQKNPIGMVCAAAGIGYLLGGGLFSPMTGRLVRYGIRLALIPLLKAQIGAALGGQDDGGAPGSTV